MAENIDRHTRFPLSEAEKLLPLIRSKSAHLSIPKLVSLSEISAAARRVAKIIIESLQVLLLKLALQMARDDYETRKEQQYQGAQVAKQSENI